LQIVSEISKGQSIESQNRRALHCKVCYASHSPSIHFTNVVFYVNLLALQKLDMMLKVSQVLIA